MISTVYWDYPMINDNNSFFHNNPDPKLAFDPNSPQIQYANPAALSYFECDSDSISGQTLDDLGLSTPASLAEANDLNVQFVDIKVENIAATVLTIKRSKNLVLDGVGEHQTIHRLKLLEAAVS